MFSQIMKDLSAKNIRAEERIAYWGLYAFSLKKNELDELCEFPSTYFANLERLKETLLSAHPQPLLIRVLSYVYETERYRDLPLQVIKRDIDRRVKAMVQHLEKSPIRITDISMRKVAPLKKIFLYGESSYVYRIAEKCRTISSGNVLATMNDCFSDSEIDFFRYADVHDALKGASVAFFSCTSITSKGFYVPQGTKTALIVAKYLHIPCYLVADSLLLTEGTGEYIARAECPKIISDVGILTHKEFFMESKKLTRL